MVVVTVEEVEVEVDMEGVSKEDMEVVDMVDRVEGMEEANKVDLEAQEGAMEGKVEGMVEEGPTMGWGHKEDMEEEEEEVVDMGEEVDMG